MNATSTYYLSSLTSICTRSFARICWGSSINAMWSTRLPRHFTISILLSSYIAISSLPTFWLPRTVRQRFAISDLWGRWRGKRRCRMCWRSTLLQGGTARLRLFWGRRHIRRLRMFGVLAVWLERLSGAKQCFLGIPRSTKFRGCCSGLALPPSKISRPWKLTSARRCLRFWPRLSQSTKKSGSITVLLKPWTFLQGLYASTLKRGLPCWKSLGTPTSNSFFINRR